MANNYCYENLENTRQFKQELKGKLEGKNKADYIYNFVINLREYCVKRKLNQKDLANLLELQPSTINPYFNGDGMPSLESLIHMAKKMNVSLDYLVGMSQNETITNENIRKKTGLNDVSIQNLEQLYIKSKLNLDMLNLFLKDTAYLEEIICIFSEFRLKLQDIFYEYEYYDKNEINEKNKNIELRDLKKNLFFDIQDVLNQQYAKYVQYSEKEAIRLYKEENNEQ